MSAESTEKLATGVDREAESTEDASSVDKPLGSRAPHFIKRSRTLHVSWQVVIFVVGLAVVAAGVAMLALPGPGWLVIFAGIGIWSTEFPWAQRVMRWTKQQLHRWTQWAKARRDERRRRKEAKRRS